MQRKQNLFNFRHNNFANARIILIFNYLRHKMNEIKKEKKSILDDSNN